MKRRKSGCCRKCGAVGCTQWHHLLGGPQRKAADREGLVIELCPACHVQMHTDADLWLQYKKRAQRAWERREGNDRKKWMRLFHRNYLDTLGDEE